jgi:molybdate transport system substrate-binding protein
MFLFPLSSHAQETLRVAVASNFIEPFNAISALFDASRHIRIEPVFSNTGRFYAQIMNGAPFDVFLASDEQRPRQIFEQGLADKPFVYAKGQVVLWTVRKELCVSDDWKALITRADVRKIAIANTENALYGTAAMIALKSAGLWSVLQDKLVYPQDVAQVFQYASTGSVDAGFCALSAALSTQGRSGCYAAIPEAPGLVQAGCVLRRTTLKASAERFVTFLSSPEAEKIKRQYGYQ